MNIGEYLRARREEKRLTISKVAEYVGVSESTVSRWERGMIGEMGRTKIAKLSEILEISPAIIVGFDDFSKSSKTVQTQSFAGNVTIANGSINQNLQMSDHELLKRYLSRTT
ncbi:helix-turn-helix domain-containing protein [Allobaculum sp. Allo2]|uniref:helix-turn-helix domain-containing protein n=1 Tax=Allobaculum sp. Allo2 TaxID=2853432 RepID=UPI001F61265E|nr:helix-turn-helix transcriptional regulator [Allobaculum sp. Allo2]UNT92643.1 helix-turn-helix domain-containing protein [Allobaculum sp. Allo2]